MTPRWGDRLERQRVYHRSCGEEIEPPSPTGDPVTTRRLCSLSGLVPYGAAPHISLQAPGRHMSPLKLFPGDRTSLGSRQGYNTHLPPCRNHQQRHCRQCHHDQRRDPRDPLPSTPALTTRPRAQKRAAEPRGAHTRPVRFLLWRLVHRADPERRSGLAIAHCQIGASDAAAAKRERKVS